VDNTPINAYQQLMAITAEECGELTQVCMKHIRKFNDATQLKDTKWEEKLIEEAGDVLCMIELIVEHGLITDAQLRNRVNIKREKLKIWSDLIE
jgi:NTP pyrophosphatase (non-canonical NTP hydrolase)|tara:strand:- start:2607 stop:2888 length:282 start_codon:yes stop_codon:yes gene_type:complete